MDQVNRSYKSYIIVSLAAMPAFCPSHIAFPSTLMELCFLYISALLYMSSVYHNSVLHNRARQTPSPSQPLRRALPKIYNPTELIKPNICEYACGAVVCALIPCPVPGIIQLLDPSAAAGNNAGKT